MNSEQLYLGVALFAFKKTRQKNIMGVEPAAAASLVALASERAHAARVYPFDAHDALE